MGEVEGLSLELGVGMLRSRNKDEETGDMKAGGTLGVGSAL